MRNNINPILSIGMPVYNSAKTVERAVGSLIDQIFTDFELIISDNCSKDGTYEILQNIAITDSRIKLVRQPANIGAIKNFEYVLFRSTGKYFMWAAADDLWLPEFAMANIEFLNHNLDYVSSISSVQFDGSTDTSSFTTGTYSLRDTYEKNIEAYILNPAANSRFYAVHKSAELKKAWSHEIQWAHDWIVICKLLKYGKFNEFTNVLMHRGNNGASRNLYKTIIATQELTTINKVFPFLKFTAFVMQIRFLRRNMKIINRLIILNTIYTVKMLSGFLKSIFIRS